MNATDTDCRLIYTWKGIQSFFGGVMSVNKLKRLAREEGLPVYKELGGDQARVWACTDDLLKWQVERKRHIKG